jgi:hypothetical protein
MYLSHGKYSSFICLVVQYNLFIFVFRILFHLTATSFLFPMREDLYDVDYLHVLFYETVGNFMEKDPDSVKYICYSSLHANFF